MMTRKITVKSDSKIDELITSLLNEQYTSNCLQAQIIAQSQSLSLFFNNIDGVITPNNLVEVKKYQTLSDGIYILLKGQISFMHSCSYNQNQKDPMRYKYMNFRGTQTIFDNFSVFECSIKNCTAIEESFLLKITIQQAIQTNFYDLSNKRRDLYQNNYIVHSHQLSLNIQNLAQIFNTDLKLHSNFRYKKYTFRQIIQPKQIAIISQGRVKLKLSHGYIYQIQKYGVLIPNQSYQVTTAEIQIMIILGSESISIKHNNQLRTFTEFRVKQTPSIKCKPDDQLLYQSNKKRDPFEKYPKTKQKQKRQKQITKLSKQSQNYSIISSFLCQKSLNYAQKQNFINRIKSDKLQRLRNPTVLFNISNQKFKVKPHNMTQAISTPQRQQKYINNSNFTNQLQKHSNINLLRKLKLPLSDYEKLTKKHGSKHSSTEVRSNFKAKSLISLSIKRSPKNIKQNQNNAQIFVRYQDT